ncbi:MAG: IMP cyclohydrolase / Phosphoribosylaminoimidazolecarboxamide formyltransferase, partial [uncultured Solirubrobacteraceae bacterium]
DPARRGADQASPAVGLRQAGHRGLREGALRARGRDRLDGRHGRRAHRRGPRGPRDRGLHGLPRDHGRAGQDPAPEALRRAARAPRRAVAHDRRRGAVDRVRRPRLREPLPLRGDRRQARGVRARDRREHRHRRPDDDPRGSQERRVLRRGGQARELRRRPAGAARRRRAPLPRHPREPGRRGVRLHRALRLGHRAVVRREAGRLPRGDHERLREGRRPLLRREPAPARRLLLAG